MYFKGLFWKVKISPKKFFLGIFWVFWPKFPISGENGLFLGESTHFRPFFQKKLKNLKNLEHFSYLHRTHIPKLRSAKIH